MGHETGEPVGLGRREVVLGSVAAVAALTGGRALARQDAGETPVAPTRTFPMTEPALARRFVGASHGQLEMVEAMVRDQEDLAKSSIDWGFGDWESAIGAASHTGRRDIAEFLMAHGARPTLFTMAMMGWTDAVRGVLTAQPDLARLRGPHDLTLVHHARQGGEQAAGTLEYLLTVPGTDEPAEGEVVDGEDADPYLGTYRSTEGPETMEVKLSRAGLAVKVGDNPQRAIYRLDERRFRPVGTRDVRVVFDLIDGKARKLMVVAPKPVFAAERIG